MVKYVYYKKQATGCTWHLLSEMDARLIKRRQQDKKRKEQARKDQLMIGYINVRHPLIYKEALEYYSQINRIYPDKHNLLKTPRFKELKPRAIKDNMDLRIPLLEPFQHMQQQQPSANQGSLSEDMNAPLLPPDLENINPDSMIPEIPPEQIQTIIDELQTDLDLRRVIDEYEKVMEDPDIDIDIDFPDLLENELLLQ